MWLGITPSAAPVCLFGIQQVHPRHSPASGYLDAEGKVGLYRLEVSITAGTGKLRTPSGLETGLRESLNRAFGHLQQVKEELGLTAELAQKDVYAEAVDLSGGRVECSCGVAFFVAMMSAIRNRQVQAGTVAIGDLTVQGNIKGPLSINEALQLSLSNGAVRAIVPLANKSQFAGLPEEVVEKMDIVFCGDVDRPVLKAIEA